MPIQAPQDWQKAVPKNPSQWDMLSANLGLMGSMPIGMAFGPSKAALQTALKDYIEKNPDIISRILDNPGALFRGVPSKLSKYQRYNEYALDTIEDLSKSFKKPYTAGLSSIGDDQYSHFLYSSPEGKPVGAMSLYKKIPERTIRWPVDPPAGVHMLDWLKRPEAERSTYELIHGHPTKIGTFGVDPSSGMLGNKAAIEMITEALKAGADPFASINFPQTQHLLRSLKDMALKIGK